MKTNKPTTSAASLYVSILITVLILCPIFYNMGFFFKIDRTFFAFLSLKDHLTSLPLFSAISVAIIFLAFCFSKHLEPYSRISLCILLLLFCSMPIAGYLNAKSKLSGNIHSVETHSRNIEKDVIILRLISTGIFVKEYCSGKIFFISKDSFETIEYSKKARNC